MKNQVTSFVEIKTVTWSKDSHGLFDYESKNVNFNKNKIETSSKVYKDGNGVAIKALKDSELKNQQPSIKDENYLFSVYSHPEKADNFFLKVENIKKDDNAKTNNLFLIVRSLKTEEGVQKGYNLELGDIIRLGRIEYRVIEYQDHNLQTYSLLNNSTPVESYPFSLVIKDCNGEPNLKRQCRICLMDEQDSIEVLVNPCNCKGTSEYVHIKCLQDWINSKVKKKVNPRATCFYWKKLNCEVCKVPLPDLVDVKTQKMELVPIYRPENPYILLERVFYDKSKENSDSAKMMILLSVPGDSNQIKMGRGHECDLRENDISVSRLHAYIKYENGQFIIIDNNSKFGTLILLRKNYKIEKKKIALQIGRTVITFSLKQSSANNVPVFKHPLLMEKLTKWQSPKNANSNNSKPSLSVNNKHKNTAVSVPGSSNQQQESDVPDQGNLNGSFI
jgi:hypothetical protein